MTGPANGDSTPRDAACRHDWAEWAAEQADRIEMGEPPALDALDGLPPAEADELRQLLSTIRRVASFGHGAPDEDDAAAPSLTSRSRMLGDFRLIREVGHGGMGVVYEAEQVTLRRRVALKVLHLATALDRRHHKRFLIEARAAAALRHRHIVPVHAVGSEHGIPYYVMQFIDGCTLAQVLEQLPGRDGASPGGAYDSGTIPPTCCGPPAERPPARPPASAPGGAGALAADVLPGSSHRDPEFIRAVSRLGLQAADALAHAHSLGVIHRDVKPGNLMLDAGGHLWVTDFGLAQVEGDNGLTRTGDVIGTVRYMSPEAARGAAVDHRTDIYSLGATLYELLALRPVFDAEDRSGILRQITDGEPTPLRRLNPAVPRDLETVLHKALAREPSSRYPTARALADDLTRFLEGRPVVAQPPGLIDRTIRLAARHHPAVLAATLTTALVVLAVVGGLAWSNHRLRRLNEELTRERNDSQRLAMQLRKQRLDGGRRKNPEDGGRPKPSRPLHGARPPWLRPPRSGAGGADPETPSPIRHGPAGLPPATPRDHRPRLRSATAVRPLSLALSPHGRTFATAGPARSAALRVGAWPQERTSGILRAARAASLRSPARPGGDRYVPSGDARLRVSEEIGAPAYSPIVRTTRKRALPLIMRS